MWELLHRMLLVAVAAVAAPAFGWTQAHDHGPAQRVIQVAPRAEFRNANHEGVLTYENGRLILYLQRFTDGTPLANARVEATVNFMAEPLTEIAPGVYAADIGLTSGRNEIELEYWLGKSRHMVATALAMPGRAGTAARNSAPSRTAGLPSWLLIGIAAGLYVLVSIVLIGGSSRRQSPVRSA